MENATAQAVGFLAVAAFLISYQIKSNRALFLCQMIGSGLFCLQFFLLGAASGCVSLGVNILRAALLLQYDRWGWVRRKVTASLFCGAYGAVLMLPPWPAPWATGGTTPGPSAFPTCFARPPAGCCTIFLSIPGAAWSMSP